MAGLLVLVGRERLLVGRLGLLVLVVRLVARLGLLVRGLERNMSELQKESMNLPYLLGNLGLRSSHGLFLILVICWRGGRLVAIG